MEGDQEIHACQFWSCLSSSQGVSDLFAVYYASFIELILSPYGRVACCNVRVVCWSMRNKIPHETHRLRNGYILAGSQPIQRLKRRELQGARVDEFWTNWDDYLTSIPQNKQYTVIISRFWNNHRFHYHEMFFWSPYSFWAFITLPAPLTLVCSLCECPAVFLFVCANWSHHIIRVGGGTVAGMVASTLLVVLCCNNQFLHAFFAFACSYAWRTAFVFSWTR